MSGLWEIVARLSAAAGFADLFAAGDHAVDGEEGDGSKDGRDEAGGFAGGIPVHAASDEVGDECAGDAEEGCDDEAAWIAAGHKGFCD